jgi:hypothetical protein
MGVTRAPIFLSLETYLMDHLAQSDYVDISRFIQAWGFSRDNCEWDALLDAYAVDGQMSTSWGKLAAADFVAACRNGMNQNRYAVLHSFGGSAVSVNGDRALVRTRMTLMLRGELYGHEVDVTSHGITYDRMVRTPSGWKIFLRSNMYEKSRIDAVMPGTDLSIDQDKLLSYPEAYRHLAYFQVANGAKVPRDLPRPGSTELLFLIKAGEAWFGEHAVDETRSKKTEGC